MLQREHLKGFFFVKTKCKYAATSKQGKRRAWSRKGEELPCVVKRGTTIASCSKYGTEKAAIMERL